MSPRIRFLVGGAQKAGTSALAAYLSEHPGLALPTGKEAHVFDAPDFDEAWTPEQIDAIYAPHFPAADTGALHGDATPIYCAFPRLVERIARYNPAMRWILLLRDPVDRAISQYRMERQRGTESWPILPAMLFEGLRLRGHENDWAEKSPLRLHSYRLRGDYARQLDTLLAHFPAAQLLVLQQTDLEQTPGPTLAKVYDFLGVASPTSPPEPRRVFEGDYRPYPDGHPVRRLLRWLLRDEIAALRDRHGITF